MNALATSGRCTRVQPGNGDATTSIQRALDDCFRAGGGTVRLEPGTHRVRGLRVRSGTTLLLRSGAVLEASRAPEDFDVLANDALEPVPAEAFAPGVVWAPAWKRKTHDHILKPASRWNNAIIRIYRARDVRIVGEPGSAIDGRDGYDPLGEEGFRGVHGIAAHDSENLEFRGYEIRNTGNWAHSIWRCRDLAFTDLAILGGHDGIHLCSCDRATIERCTMKTGDDCVAGFDDEDVAVRDCDLNTACSAFRFGGRRVLVERCRAHGPGEYPIRNTLPEEDRISGAHREPGAGRRTMLSLFTYYADFTLAVRHDPGEIVLRDCSLENAERFLHYNFSGNEVWQKGIPLSSIRFEGCEASGVGMSLCAYGDASRPLSLSFERCRFAFAPTQAEFLRAAHVGALSLHDVRIGGVRGPLVRSWGNVAAPVLGNAAGFERAVVPADGPFETAAI